MKHVFKVIQEKENKFLTFSMVRDDTLRLVILSLV